MERVADRLAFPTAPGLLITLLALAIATDAGSGIAKLLLDFPEKGVVIGS